MSDVFEQQQVKTLTHFFRTCRDPFWTSLREVIRGRGLTPDSTWLARSHEDDVRLDFGILVTGGRQVIQYAYHYPDDSGANGRLTEWNDLTETWATSPYSSEVSAALSMIG